MTKRKNFDTQYDYEEFINWIEKEYDFKFKDIGSLSELQDKINKITKNKANGENHTIQGRIAIDKIIGDKSDYNKDSDGPPTSGKDNEIKAAWKRLVEEEKAREKQTRLEEFQAEQERKTQEQTEAIDTRKALTLADEEKEFINSLKTDQITFHDVEFQTLFDKLKKDDDYLSPQDQERLDQKKDSLRSERQAIIERLRDPELIEITKDLETFELRALENELFLGRPNQKAIESSISSVANKLGIQTNKTRAKEIAELLRQATKKARGK